MTVATSSGRGRLGRPLGEAADGRHLVDLLERLVAEVVALDLADDGEHRGGILAGRVDADGQVAGADGARGQARRGATGQLPVGLGHERGRALVARGDDPDAGVAERVEQPEERLAGDGEGVADPGRAQGVGDQPADGPRCVRIGCLRGRGVVVLGRGRVSGLALGGRRFGGRARRLGVRLRCRRRVGDRLRLRRRPRVRRLSGSGSAVGASTGAAIGSSAGTVCGSSLMPVSPRRARSHPDRRDDGRQDEAQDDDRDDDDDDDLGESRARHGRAHLSGSSGTGAGTGSSSSRRRVMTRCRSSLFLPDTRTASPWICDLTLGNSSRMSLVMRLATSSVRPRRSLMTWRTVLPPAGSTLPQSKILSDRLAADRLRLDEVLDRGRPGLVVRDEGDLVLALGQVDRHALEVVALSDLPPDLVERVAQFLFVEVAHDVERDISGHRCSSDSRPGTGLASACVRGWTLRW